MSEATGWGYRRALGEFRKPRIRFIFRATVAGILRKNGFDPGPKRGTGTWQEFAQRHMKTLWAADFFTKSVRTLRGRVTYCVLFIIHLHARKVHLAGMTPKLPSNRRNGRSRKTVRGDLGELSVATPRDRAGTFELQLIGKHQRRLPGFDEKILALYAKGMTRPKAPSSGWGASPI